MKYLATKVTNYFIRKNIVKEDEQETYIYCFELLIATIVNLLVMLVIAVATQLYLESFIFTIVFMSMRGICGGYHANTHLTCFLTLMIVFGAFITMLKLINVIYLFYISIGCLVLASIIICLLAPIDSITKPLTIKEYKKNKKKSIALLSFYIGISIILLIFQKTRYFSFCLTYPLIAVAIMLIVGYIKNLIQHSKEQKFQIVEE